MLTANQFDLPHGGASQALLLAANSNATVSHVQHLPTVSRRMCPLRLSTYLASRDAMHMVAGVTTRGLTRRTLTMAVLLSGVARPRENRDLAIGSLNPIRRSKNPTCNSCPLTPNYILASRVAAHQYTFLRDPPN